MSELPFSRRHVLEVTGGSVVGMIGFSGLAIADESGEINEDDHPTKITDWSDLNAIREDLGGDYKLTTDLDKNTEGYNEYVENPEEGWEPIGDWDESENFSGEFDGENNTISDLKIDRSDESWVGLFGGLDGNVRNVVIDEGTIEGGNQVAALVAQSEGVIENVHIAADVTVLGDRSVGGVVGYNYDGAVSLSQSHADITATDWNSGVLVGYNGWGGLIENSYATGSIDGAGRVGGLVGLNHEATVQRSFAAGPVEGSQTGGLVGETMDATVEDSYWDAEATGQSASAGSSDQQGHTTDQMTGSEADTNMESLNFDEIWETTDEYPTISDSALQNDSEEPSDNEEDDTADEDTSEDDEEDTADDVAGFGIGSALASVGGAAYLLKNRLTNTDTESE